MFLYNITIKVDWSVHDEWLPWMRETHIPAVFAFGCFHHHELYKILHIDDTEGPTYALQLFADSQEKYNDYITQHEKEMTEMRQQTWGTHMLTFETLMRTVH